MPAQAQNKRAGKKHGNRYAPIAWGGKKAASIELRVPSGQLCLVRTVGVPGLIEAGILSHVDSLTSIVSDEFIKKNEAGNPVLDIPGITDSEGAVKSIMEVMSKVVCLAVVEPKVYEVPMKHEDPDDPESPLVEDERVEGRVYIDTVDEEDQVFIFQAVIGGTQDLEQFRDLVSELVGSLDPGDEVGGAPE